MCFRGVVRWVGAAAVGVLLVAGCSGGEDPPDSPPSASAESSDGASVGASAEAASDGGASAESGGDTDGGSGGNSDGATEVPSPDPNRPEAQLPNRPAAMDEHTVEGAIAAGKYFVQLYPYIYATGDLSEWNKLSDEGCGFCSSAQDRVSELHEGGGYATGGVAEIRSADGGGPYERGTFVVEFDLRFAPTRLVLPDGSQREFQEDERPSFLMTMVWRDGGWIVTGVTLDSSEAGKS